MAVQPSPQAVKKRRTLRFRGSIGQQEFLILLDSGSSVTFINSNLVTKLNLLKEGCDPIQFMLAEGSTMLSDTVIPELQWHVQVIH
jgi:hypothetical protein